VIGLHRLAKLLAASTFILVTAGGLVTSTGSGLSVPDWPTTYGWSMFTFPLSRWVGGILYEHGHRLIATCVGMLTIALAVWIWLKEERLWVRTLSLVALMAVVTQGILGGITVLLMLPPPVSIGHAGLAQVFFCLTVTLAIVTSPGWRRQYASTEARAASTEARATSTEAGATSTEARATPAEARATSTEAHATRPETRATVKDAAAAGAAGIPDDPGLRRLTVLTIAVIYLQILIGATMRHTGAGLAIPDFPLAFGQIVPPPANLVTGPVAVHFAHRLVALAAAGLIFASTWRVWRAHRGVAALARPALLASLLVVVQIGLGGAVVLSGRHVAVNTAHVANGALVLATSLALALRSFLPFRASVPLAAGAPAPGSARG
jgi:cytochrome c oxidase assembly protein subunit 15